MSMNKYEFNGFDDSWTEEKGKEMQKGDIFGRGGRGFIN